MGEVEVHAVNGIDLEIHSGELTAIVGQSGSGKSTLMHILGCLDTPTSGTVYFNGEDISSVSDERLSVVRNSEIGFVFQSFNLLSHRNILENVMLPMVYKQEKPETRKKRASNILSALRLGDRLLHKPTELSGGQNQRVAIARALANNPSLVLADEPTGNLDSNTSKEIMALFQELNRLGKTMIMVTHDQNIAKNCQRIVEIMDGKIVKDFVNKDFKKTGFEQKYDLERILEEE